MKKDNNKVVPIIVDGNLNLKKKKTVSKDKALPTKTFTFTDLLLTLIGIFLVGYGIYGTLKDNDDKPKKEKEVVEKVDIKYENYVLLDVLEKTNVYNNNDNDLMENGITVNKLSNNAKLYLASKLLSNKNNIKEEELDNCIKKLFGNIAYIKTDFIGGNNLYKYNKDTKSYNLIIKDNITLDYKKYNYIVKEENNNKLVIKEYVVYTNNKLTKSWTINNAGISEIITDNNIKDKYKILKYYEYQFKKINNEYKLYKITVK